MVCENESKVFGEWHISGSIESVVELLDLAAISMKDIFVVKFP